MAAKEAAPLPPTPEEGYRAALDEGRMTFQRCAECGHAWLPAREECPKCWSPKWRREEASGEAKVVSWVVYHTAFDKRFAERLPYNVALVELAEGPRMITNLVEIPAGADVIIPAGADVIGRSVSLEFEKDMGRLLPRYRLRE